MMESKYLKRLLRLSPFAKSRLYHSIRFSTKKKRIKKYVERRGEDFTFWGPIIREAMVDYHWDPNEVFMYNYIALSPEKRREFVPEYEKNIFCDRVNDYDGSKVFDSKWRSYCVFKQYYKRECCLLTNDLLRKGGKDIIGFLKKNRDFIFKPDSNASGRGIVVIRSASFEESVDRLRAVMENRRGSFIIEELIEQNLLMGRFHPSSVNSLRIRTFRFDDRVEILPSNMRIGQGDSVVDNTGQGGISAAIDENGYIFTACDEAGIRYDTHPDSGERIIGERVPFWEDAVSFVKRLASVIPTVRYVGWDIALTNDGWVMIEGNDKGMFVGIQKPRQEGFRPNLNRILSELQIKL